MGLLPRSFILTRPRILLLPAVWFPLLMGAALGFVLDAPAQSQSPGNIPVYYSRRFDFRIPFETESGARRLQEVQLWVSEDQGQNWIKYSSAQPDDRGFSFHAEHDGMHWFSVRTMEVDGRLNPPTVPELRPQMKVVVDTHEPVITLRSRPAGEGMIGVDWDIREDNPDFGTFALEYRLPATTEWIPLLVNPALKGERFWSPGTNGAVEVRLRLRDLAKNDGEGRITIGPGGQDSHPSGNVVAGDPARSLIQPAPATQWVNSKRISLNYEIKEDGPSGVSVVELWGSRDGRTWKKYSEDTAAKPPYVFEVPDEGLYGFRLVVRNGVGLGGDPPQPGDPPQVWVEVDLTPPIVHWVQAEVGRGDQTGNLTITWSAADKHFGREPIRVSYAADEQGTWTTIAENLPNNGSYTWKKGPGPPFKFKVKVEATDKAGNTGAAITQKFILFDLAQPKGLILGVGAADWPAGH
jgi:hypothetical protein